jgi:hypothetical protein
MPLAGAGGEPNAWSLPRPGLLGGLASVTESDQRAIQDVALEPRLRACPRRKQNTCSRRC